ncbi:MAG: preprotein translocase subunit SecE [Candidatus Omnitrophica bacterium]|nr:preprotein translocase subunit SecE [Candidatus Omnitrophota bacterium]
MGIFSKPVNFLKEVKAELGKVSWSNRQELLGSTVVVIVATAIVATYIGIIDVFLTQLLKILFR